METSLRFYDNPWTIGESFFNPQWLAKYETIFAQGNGYMGVRTATEERYIGEKRNTFVAGTFNQFDETEVTELPNVPDVTHIKISIDGEVLDLTLGEVSQYERKLNLKNGEVVRKFVWTTPKGKKVKFEFKRFVSMDQKHILGQKMIMIPLNFSGKIELFSGIDGQQTNSGSQHFRDGKKRLYKNFILQLNAQTINSKIDFILNTSKTVPRKQRMAALSS
ncbi:hypothetical protein [Aerococcus urinae]